MRLVKSVLVASIASLFALPAMALDLGCEKSYAFRTDVNEVPGNTICVSKATSFLDAMENFQLSNSRYTPFSAAQVLGRFSDVNLNMSYLQGSNTLNYNFVELGERGSFTGANRDESQDMFVDYVKKSDIIGRIMNYQAKHSASSPIVGAGGLIPSIGANDFAASFDTASKVVSGAETGAGAGNLIGVGISYGSYKVSGAERISSTSLPLSYTIRNDIDPRRQLIFSLPISQISTGDANSYHAGLGLAYRLPLSDNWTLTPGAKYSVVASKERATAASVFSVSLMSTYLIPREGYDLAIGNMLGYYKTGKFSNGDYSFNPDINLTMTRNGILLSTPTNMFGKKMAIEYSFIDSRYIGDKPFLSNTQEIGITVGTNKNASNARSFTRMGATYLRGKDTNGFNVNFGYWF